MKRLIYIVSILLLSACSTMQVTSDYDRTVDFSQYKTYSFLGWDKDSGELLSKFDRDRFEKAFDDQFEQRGFQKVDEGGDIVVSLFVVIDEKTGKTAYTTHLGGPYGYGYRWGWGMGTSYTTIEEYDYEVGTLVVDVFDSKSKQLIWQGVGSDTVIKNPKQRAQKIPYFARNIMYKFPVKPWHK